MEEEPPQSSSMSTPQTLQLKYDLIIDKYLDLIADLRDEARDKDKFCHGRPVLPLESDANPPYINVYLQENGTSKGFVKIRRRVIGVTCQDVAQFLGIIRGAPPLLQPIKEEYLSGKTLFEVFSVSVYIDGGRSGNVFGSIKVYNHNGGFSIYKRDSNDCEFIESHGTLSLQGPNDRSFIQNKLHIEVDLTEAGKNEEISKGEISWTDHLREDYYNSRITGMVRGKNGYAIVYFSVCSKAVQALVEVTLLIKGGHGHASDDVCVCGRLYVLYSDFSYAADFHEKYYQIRLFDKPVNKEQSALPCLLETGGMCNRVKLQEAINLSRSRVTVPVDSSLIIKAELKTCGGKPIVTGSMEWIPKELGEFEGIMEGHPNDSHLLRVKVKWIER